RGIVAGDAFLPERQEELAGGVELEGLHVAAVRDPDVAGAVDAQEVGGLEHALAPGAEEFTVAVEGHDGHGVVAMKNVDVVVSIDIDARGSAPFGHAGGKLGPVFDQLVMAFSGVDGSGVYRGGRGEREKEGSGAAGHDWQV